MTAMPATLGQHLEFYEELGLNLIPLQPATVGDARTGKRPIFLNREFLDWAPYQKRISTYAEREAWWPRRVRGAPIGGTGIQNVGVVTGSISQLIVLDLDDEATYTHLVDRIPELYDQFTVRSGRGYHIYMRPAAQGDYATRTFKLNGKTHHVKGDGGYVVAAPSLHYLGHPYAIMGDYTEAGHGAPWAPGLLTVDIMDLGAKLLAAGIEVTQPEAMSRNEPGWVEQLLAENTGEGERHTTLVRIAGHLAHVFGPYREGEAFAWLCLWNEARVVPPLSERELDKALAYAMRKERQNSEHAA